MKKLTYIHQSIILEELNIILNYITGGKNLRVVEK